MSKPPVALVSRFEYQLLHLLRFFLGHYAQAPGLGLLREEMTGPPCISPNAIRLVKDTLAKGCVQFLVRQGGWRNERYLRQGAAQTGRLWQRLPPDERRLHFSAVVLDFLIWATSQPLPQPKRPWNPPSSGLTAADELFFFLALDACRGDREIFQCLKPRNVFAHNPYCWLINPRDFLNLPTHSPPNFEPLFAPDRVMILEAIQPWLEQRWWQAEQQKDTINLWSSMLQRGQLETATLSGYLRAADEARRNDLARFILRVNARLFEQDRPLPFWIGGLNDMPPVRLADRLETIRAALAVPRQMLTLARWTERFWHVGYFDEDYAVSQWWKAEWEAVGGDRIAARARTLLESIDPLRSAPEAPPLT